MTRRVAIVRHAKGDGIEADFGFCRCWTIILSKI